MNGNFIFKPGLGMTSRTSPSRSTSASSVCSTMKSELIAKTPATTSPTAMMVRSRRFTIPSLLTAAQGRDGGHRRLRRAGGGRCGPRRAPRGAPWGRSACRCAVATEGGQRQIRKHAVPAFGGFVNDHLVAVLEHLLHRLEVEPLDRNVLRRLERAIDRDETIGIALGAGDDLLAIGFRLLLDPHGIAARPRGDVVSIGLRLVAQPLAIRGR